MNDELPSRNIQIPKWFQREECQRTCGSIHNAAAVQAATQSLPAVALGQWNVIVSVLSLLSQKIYLFLIANSTSHFHLFRKKGILIPILIPSFLRGPAHGSIFIARKGSTLPWCKPVWFPGHILRASPICRLDSFGWQNKLASHEGWVGALAVNRIVFVRILFAWAGVKGPSFLLLLHHPLAMAECARACGGLSGRLVVDSLSLDGQLQQRGRSVDAVISLLAFYGHNTSMTNGLSRMDVFFPVIRLAPSIVYITHRTIDTVRLKLLSRPKLRRKTRMSRHLCIELSPLSVNTFWQSIIFLMVLNLNLLHMYVYQSGSWWFSPLAQWPIYAKWNPYIY